MSTLPKHEQPSHETSWLAAYYLSRGVIAALWVTAALGFGKTMPVLAAILLVVYPAWDALANQVDAQRSGGLSRNPSQALNIVISTATAVAVAIALTRSLNAVLIIFGIWAILAGVLQLATGVRRWKTKRGQWLMILSGAQSALAGAFFVKQAAGPVMSGIGAVAPYAGLGAFYFLASGLWSLAARALRRPPRTTAQ